jgi:hypothetical protein
MLAVIIILRNYPFSITIGVPLILLSLVFFVWRRFLDLLTVSLDPDIITVIFNESIDRRRSSVGF